jgi:hypothetical protein
MATGVACGLMVEAQARDARGAGARGARGSSRAWWHGVLPPLVAAVAVGIVVAAEWRGADWPAQIFRIETFRSDGFTVWNNYWYGGHHSVGYSVLLPPLAVAFGTTAVALVSAVVATWGVGDLLGRLRPHGDPRAAVVGASLFAVAIAANVAVGRLPFLLGLAFVVASLVAWARGALALTLIMALLSGFASPVAALFLGVVAGGCAIPHWTHPRDLWQFRDVRGQGPLIALVAMGPVMLVAWIFPAGGSFPFTALGCLSALAAIGVVVWASDPSDRELRAVCAVAAVATVAAFVLPTPLGGNIVRLPMFGALPVLVVLLWDRRRILVVPVSILLMMWAWWPAADAILWASDDPTADASFFEPMIEVIQRESDEPARVEIPFTRRHWEAAYVAPYLPLARGWERQLDRGTNEVFYGDEPLTALDLHVWLRENAVRYVALPNAELDPSAEDEAALLEMGQPFLRPVWESEDWRVWEVTTGAELVRGDAELVELRSDSVVLDVARPDDVLVRVRYSPHWAVDGETCVMEDPDGWTLLHVVDAGPVEMIISPDALAGVGDEAADPCDPEIVAEVEAGLPGPQVTDDE